MPPYTMTLCVRGYGPSRCPSSLSPNLRLLEGATAVVVGRQAAGAEVGMWGPDTAHKGLVGSRQGSSGWLKPEQECEGGEGVQRKGLISRFRAGNQPRPPHPFPSSARTVWGRVGKRVLGALSCSLLSRNARAPSLFGCPGGPRWLRAPSRRGEGESLRRCQIRSAQLARWPAPPAGRRPPPAERPRQEGGAGRAPVLCSRAGGARRLGLGERGAASAGVARAVCVSGVARARATSE